MNDFLIGLINWAEKTAHIILSLGMWALVGVFYALIGFVVGTYFRKKHDHDSLNYPIWSMFLFLFLLLPFTVYCLG